MPEPQPEPTPRQEIEDIPMPSAIEESAPSPSEEALPQPGPKRSATSGNSASAGEQESVVPPRVDASHLNNPAPSYPPRSRRMGEEGKVVLDVHILPDGSVREVRLRASSGHRRLDRAAMDAVQRWRYIPAHRGGKPIAYWYVQPIVFSLNN